MKQFFNLFIGYLLVMNTAIAQRSNCGAYPDAIHIEQPNGSKVSAFIKGNEMLHRYESLDGYAILQNPSNGGTYEYATLNSEGDLVPSGILATQTLSNQFGKTMIAKHLNFSANQRANAKEAFLKEAIQKQYNKTANGSFPSKGTNKLLVVLMQFPDEPATYSRQSFIDLMSQEGYSVNGGTGSFRQYYAATSFGQLNIQVTVLGFYTATRNRIAYGKTDAAGNTNPNSSNNTRELVAQALDSAEAAGINFSDFDNNKDGEMDGLMVFHSGFGAEQGKNGYIWSHRSSLWGSASRVYGGVSINDYCINPSKRDFGGIVSQVRIGVATHEFGHILGLPDLYDTGDGSEGAGNWGLMAGGPWMNSERTPCQLEAWSKIELGWLTPRLINAKGKYSLKHAQDSNICFKVLTPDPTQFFLLENRQQKGWDRYLPGRGLAIWHINSTIADRYSLFGSNDVNTDTSNFGVGMIQADGLRDLERKADRGDAGDTYPGSTLNRAFTPNSNPNSNLHTNSMGVRPPSNVFITNITQTSDSLITFDIGSKSAANFVASTLTGCAPLTVNFDNQSVFASSYSWNLGNGQTSINKNVTATYTKPGNYKTTLLVYDSGQVVADSFSVTINVFESPKAGFSAQREGNKFTFTNSSTGASSYYWQFGANTTSSNPNPVLTVNGTGMLEFFMVAYNNNGCTDTIKGSMPLYPTSIDEQLTTLALQAYPNPFDKSTTIEFDLKQTEKVMMEIFDVLGKRVGSYSFDERTIGINRIMITDEMVANQGIYIVKLSAGGQQGIQRLVKQ